MQNEAQYELDRKAAKISVLSSNNLDKYEYLSGEDLGLKPKTIEQAKFEYSPLGKILNKGLSGDDKNKVLFKRLKNTENKIKHKNKKELEPIKNDEQSQVLNNESNVADKNPKEIVLLKDKLDYIFKDFDTNFNSTGKYFLKQLAKDEQKIDYNNLFFEIDDKSVVKDVDFLKEIGTLYDLLIYLLDNSMSNVTSIQTQIDFFKAITVLRITISNMKTDSADQSEEEKKKIFAEQENVLSNAEMLLKKRGELIDQFSKNDMISISEKFYYAPKKSEKSISEKLEQKSEQSFPKWVQVAKDRFDFIKLKINTNKTLATMIDNKRYTLDDANELLNKITGQKIGKNNTIK